MAIDELLKSIEQHLGDERELMEATADSRRSQLQRKVAAASRTLETELTAAERRLVIKEVHEALRQDCPELLEQARSQPHGGLADLDAHIDELVPIVCRSTAVCIEPYLAQILDDICTKCPYQQPSQHCPLRYAGQCMLYRFAGPIVAAVRRALREIDIDRRIAGRKE